MKKETTNFTTSHIDLAKDAKDKAVKGQHKKALELYKEALRQARQQNAHSIMMRHYSECALESMEQLGQFDEVIQYCLTAIHHYKTTPPESDIAKKDLASLYQRLALMYLKQGIKGEAVTSVEFAEKIATEINLEMPLLTKIKDWAKSPLHLDENRILQEQKKYDYFTVRKENLARAQ